ncbi:MAG: TRAP transporter large permease [Limnochordia bacterium]|jgi:C4-dicarboxylate transporter DctM subunit
MAALLVLGLIALLVLGFPIGISMGIVSIYYLIREGIPLEIAIQQMYQGTNVFVLLAIPLFMVASSLMNHGTITDRLVNLCDSFLGHIRGGLAHVNVLVSMIFAGMSGSALADTAGIGGVLIPEMIKQGYDKDFTVAVTATSSVIGPIIPPSIPMVLTAAMAGVSVGKMFLGGAIPGILFTVLQMVLVAIISVKRQYPVSKRAPLAKMWRDFKRAIVPLLMPVILLGGIFTGIFTPTEAASVAVTYALVLGLVIYRTISWENIRSLSLEVALHTAVIMFIVAMAQLYGWVLTRERLPQYIFSLMTRISQNPQTLLVIVVFGLVGVGCFMSTTPTLMLTIPILIPIARGLGFDPLHFFVVVTMAACLGTITPPVGLTLYLAASIAKMPVEKTLKMMIPFGATLIVVTIIAIYFPPLVTWLPNLLLN